MMKFFAVIAILTLTSIATMPFSAAALTPLKSPEQRAQDDILFARASQSIEQAAMRCFIAPSARLRKPVTIRFFLAGAGKQVSQLKAIESPPQSGAMQRAALRAIKNCAPYGVPEELRNWGGFWATVRFR